MKRFVIIGSVVAALFLLLLFVWPRGSGNPGTPEVFELAAPRALADTNTNTAPNADTPKLGIDPGEVGSIATATNQDNEFELLVRKSTEAANIPLAFYGMVVDQDSNALQNVSVDLQVIEERIDSYPHHNQKRTPLQKQTDADGRFDVIGSGLKGRFVLVFMLTKEGYDQELPGAMYGAQSGSGSEPVVFRMWSTNLHEPLIGGDKSFDLVPDGRHYVIDLTKGRIAEGEVGDLVVWVKRPEKVGWGQRYNWSCEMSVPEGGLLESQSQAMFTAPESGYTNLFAFQEQENSNGSGCLQDKRFYVQLRNGQMYGRIVISLYPNFSRTKLGGQVRLTYTVNPSGSRLLR